MAYEMYKLQWRISHIPPEAEIEVMRDYLENLKCSCDLYPFDEYLDEFGYFEELYCCYDEFISNEYEDKEYMKELLNSDDLYMKYLCDIESN
jgi:hypothetical protein